MLQKVDTIIIKCSNDSNDATTNKSDFKDDECMTLCAVKYTREEF